MASECLPTGVALPGLCTCRWFSAVSGEFLVSTKPKLIASGMLCELFDAGDREPRPEVSERVPNQLLAGVAEAPGDPWTLNPVSRPNAAATALHGARKVFGDPDEHGARLWPALG